MKTKIIYTLLAFSFAAHGDIPGGAIPVRLAHATGSVTANSGQEICHIDATVPVYNRPTDTSPWGQPAYIECKTTIDGKAYTINTALTIEVRKENTGVVRKWLDATTFVNEDGKPQGKSPQALVTGTGTQNLNERYFSVYTERSVNGMFVMMTVNIDDQDVK